MQIASDVDAEPQGQSHPPFLDAMPHPPPKDPQMSPDPPGESRPADPRHADGHSVRRGLEPKWLWREAKE